MRKLFGVIALLFVLFGPGTLLADSRLETQRKVASREAWKKGVAAYNKGDFDRAIARFEEAYALNASPTILFNLGQAYRKKGDAGKALEYLREYLEKRPDAPNRKVAEDLIAELQKASPPAAAAEAPPAPPPVVAPAVEPQRMSLVEGAEARPWYSDRTALVLGGAGVALTALGIAFLIHSGNLVDEATTTRDSAEAIDINDSAKTFRIAGGLTTVAGVGCLAAGALELFMRRRSTTTQTASWSIGPAWVTVEFAFE